MAIIGTSNAAVHTAEISKAEDVQTSKTTKSKPKPVPQLPTLEK